MITLLFPTYFFQKGNQHMSNSSNKENQPKKKVTSKQIVAIIGIVLLVLMYLVTLLAALFDNSASGRLFVMSLFATMVIPIMIWIYTWMYGKLTGKHTIADFEVNHSADSDKTE